MNEQKGIIMSEKTKRTVLLAVAFLAGVAVTAIVAFALLGHRGTGSSAQQGTQGATVSANNIDYSKKLFGYNYSNYSRKIFYNKK